MEKFSEREMARGLRRFEEIWRRVSASKALAETAERCGVKLMPRRGCPRRCGRRP